MLIVFVLVAGPPGVWTVTVPLCVPPPTTQVSDEDFVTVIVPHAVPLMVTESAPQRFFPLIVIVSPTDACFGTDFTCGAGDGSTTNGTALESPPVLCRTRFPSVVPVATLN